MIYAGDETAGLEESFLWVPGARGGLMEKRNSIGKWAPGLWYPDEVRVVREKGSPMVMPTGPPDMHHLL